MEAATCSTSGGGSFANAHGDAGDAGDALGDATADVASDHATHGANGTDGACGTDALGRLPAAATTGTAR